MKKKKLLTLWLITLLVSNSSIVVVAADTSSKVLSNELGLDLNTLLDSSILDRAISTDSFLSHEQTQLEETQEFEESTTESVSTADTYDTNNTDQTETTTDGQAPPPSTSQENETTAYTTEEKSTNEFSNDVVNIASIQGTWGTSSYTFDEETGILTVDAGTLNVGDRPWLSEISATSISEIVFTGSVKTPSDSSYLFSSTSTPQQLPNLTTITGLDNLDTSETINMTAMFNGCSSLEQLDLSSFDTANVTTMLYMFQGCSSLEQLDLSSFDTANVTGMVFMFNSCRSLKQLNISNFDTSSLSNTGMYAMFTSTNSLASLTLGNQFRFSSSPLLGSPAMLDGVENTGKWTRKDGQSSAYLPAAFMTNFGSGDLTAGTYVGEVIPDDRTYWGTAPYTFDEETGTLTVGSGTLNNTNQPWKNGISPSSIKKIVFAGAIKLPSDASYLFSRQGTTDCLRKLEYIDGLENFDTSETTTMEGMFRFATSIKQLDLSNFDTSKVSNFSRVFDNCIRLTKVNLSSFNTIKATTMFYMFNQCNQLEDLPITHFRTSNVKDMGGMFRQVNSLIALDLSKMDTSNVTYMFDMFTGMTSLAALTLGTQFRFIGTNAGLGTPAQLDEFENTGKWTRKDGQSAAYTPADFIRNYGSGDLTASTYIGEQNPMDLAIDILDNENNLFTVGDTQTLKIDFKPKEVIGNQHAKNIVVTIDLNDLPYWQLAASGKLTITGTSGADSSTQEVKVIPLTGEENKYQLSLPDYDPEKTTGFSLEVDGLCTNNVPMKQLDVASQDILVAATYDSGFTGTTAREVTSQAVRGIQSGRISFGDLSDVLQFDSESISALPRTRLINRQDTDWSITVNDLRGTNPLTDGSEGQSVEIPRQDWEIVATAAPFMDSEQNVIDPSTLNLVFIEDGITNPLDSENEVLIAQHSVLDEEPIKNKEHQLQWTDKEGFKVQYNTSSGIQPGRTYTSKLTLDLRSAP